MSGKATSLQAFMTQQLKEMGQNIAANLNKNMEARRGNPFLPIDETINRCMGLGRSTDSQLGNRMQNIIFYAARLKYGDQAVPNIVAIEPDEQAKTVKCVCYYVELADYELAFGKKSGGFKQNAFKQIVFVNKKIDEQAAAKILKLPEKDTIQSYETVFTAVSGKAFGYLKKYASKLKIETDLLIFETGDPIQIRTFEIKLGGSLDTKNAPANIREITALKELFAFSKRNHTYFATCYGNGSEAVARSFDKTKKPFDRRDGILKNTEFWEVVLPAEIPYPDFIRMYQEAFQQANIDETLKKLSGMKEPPGD